MQRLDISIEQWDDITGSLLSSEMADIVYMFTEGQPLRRIAGSNQHEKRRIYHLDRVARARIRQHLMDEANKIGLHTESDVGVGICHSCKEVSMELNNDPMEGIPNNQRLYGGFKLCNECLNQRTQTSK